MAESEITDEKCTPAQARALHTAIKKVSGDLETLSFNTAISALMVFVNEFSGDGKLPREAAEAFVKMLAVFAPHIGEELWEMLGHKDTVAYESWPVWDEKFLAEDEVEVLVQLMGKARCRMMMPVSASDEEWRSLALAAPEVSGAVAGKTVRKVIVARGGKLINIVAN